MEEESSILKRMKKRGFEVVEDTYRKFLNEEIRLPKRSDKGSAGYDFYTNEEALLNPGSQHIFWTDVKSYMQEDEVLKVYIRSSVGIKKGLMLSNATGIIDASYYNNENNDGNIGIAVKNASNEPVRIAKNERIVQGIFIKYLVADEDIVQNEERRGGMGSSGL